MDNNLTIIFIGYDGYSDLWEDCVSLFKRYCPDCPYRVLFVTNEKNMAWDGVETICAGKDAEWSKKVQIGLKYTSTPYVCLLLEDFFLSSKIETKQIESLITFIKDNNVDYLKLADLNKAIKDFNPSLKTNRSIHRIRRCNDYGICLQASIWNRVFLEKSWKRKLQCLDF